MRKQVIRIYRQLILEWIHFSDKKQLSIVFFILFMLAIGFWTSSYGEDFGLNAFTELLGVLFTVIVINQIYEHREKRKLLPARVLTYQECVRMTNRIIHFWSDINCAASTAATPIPKDLLNQRHIAELAQALDLNSKPPRIAGSWFIHFEQEIFYISGTHNKILNQYANYLQPKQLQLVHDISTDSMFTREIFGSMLKIQGGFVKKYANNSTKIPTYFSAYLTAPNYTFSSVIELHEWLILEYKELSDIGIAWLEPPTEKAAEKARDDAGYGMMSEATRTNQGKEPELIPQWKDVYGWQSTHPGNWWLQENQNYNDPVVVSFK